MKSKLLSGKFIVLTLGLIVVGFSVRSFAAVGDTTVVQVFRYDTTMRAGVFLFPNDTTTTYEKIIMLYSMRCKNGLISNSTYPNQGCGEWDYNCYTYIVDSSQTDSLKTRHNSHDISNFSGSAYNYTTAPVWQYIQYTQQDITYTSVISETTGTVGSGASALSNPLGASQSLSKSQYLFTAAELSSAGITAGNITGMRLDIFSLGSAVNNLRVKLKSTSQSALDANAPELTGFTEVYFLNTNISSTGLHSFNFHTPFNWDGTSNVIVEFSYTNALAGTDNTVNGHNAGFVAGLTNTVADSYLSMNGSIQYVNLNNSFFSSITNEITVSFWSYGNAAVYPANSTMMEAVDSLNRRNLNIHLPWSDANVYWDCGADAGGYDRISAADTSANFEGKWTHWTFTKNVTTGVMNIYLNGTLFKTGSNKFKPISIQEWLVGLSSDGGLKYFGNIDELSVWNKELSPASIQQIILSDITVTHPDYANLQAYYKFNEGTGTTAMDSSPNGFNSEIINPTWRSNRGHSLRRNFMSTTFRPNTTFVQGTYTTSVQTTTVLDSFLVPATSVISYNVINNALNIIDTVYVWNSGYAYVYDETGALVDSVPVATQNTINITQFVYYPKRPMRLEFINFITPYGLGLSLNGLIGKTWAFDVTDYAPVLKGARFIAMEGAPYQEDNDIRFVFYEGTPPRDVKSIQQIWPNGTWVSPSYNDIVNNNYFEPVTFQLSNSASQFKIRSAISGHGQEGEFIQRTHTLSLNGSMNFPWLLTKECATNPIYPQGGTWVFDREGWCPGAEVDNKDLELTPNVTSGQTITLDYSLPSIANPGSSNYRVNHQLVSYGPPNFTLDAAIDYIKSPGKRTEFSRFNPICDNPVIAIKNTGTTQLTSLDITYGRVGGTMANYHWTGTLDFLKSTEVVLPQPDWLSSGQNSFVARISSPNGGADQYAQNDTLYSDFDTPIMHQPDLVFELKTNHWGNENRYTLTNSNGDTIIYRDFLGNDIIYRDTVLLPNDCYTLSLKDDGGDGLYFWFYASQQGSGSFRIKKPTGPIIKSFNTDFGDNIYYQFTVGFAVDVPEPQVNSIDNFNVYPNPAGDAFATEFSLPTGSHAVVSVMNPLGETVLREEVEVSEPVEKIYFDSGNFANGIYFVSVQSQNVKQVRKLVIAR